MKTITSMEVAEIINKNRTETNEAEFYASDDCFKPMSKTDLWVLSLIQKWTALRPYKKDARDCDDFANIVVGRVSNFLPCRAFGIVWAENISTNGGYHAACCYIDDAGEFWIYEPQNGKRFQTKLSGKRTLIII